jgi:hypothetical protein
MYNNNHFDRNMRFEARTMYNNDYFDRNMIFEVRTMYNNNYFDRNMRFEAPYDVQQGENQLHFTYLDTTGRPVIVIHKSNLAEQHIQDFQVC